jgi:divalent metal cation (Fe/Co/Zn/Cd) transporter
VLRRRPGDGHDHPARLSAAPHSHGLVDESIKRSREGVRTVSASLAVLLATAIAQAVAVVAIGFDAGDPLIGLAITLVILRITWQSWQTIAGHGYHHH